VRQKFIFLKHILPVAARLGSEKTLENFGIVKQSRSKNHPLRITTQTQLKQTIVVTSRAATSSMSNRKSALVNSVNTIGRGV
jgi:hypothetical protein